MRRARRLAIACLAGLLGLLAVGAFAQPSATNPGASDLNHSEAGLRSDAPLRHEGRDLYLEGCSSCHGFDARGVPGQGPSLIGAGAAAADFYLRTGRMPLDQVGEQPLRAQPRYSEQEIRALVAYAGSLGGTPIPVVEPEEGSLSKGLELFGQYCSGCHAISGKGGVAIGGYAPPLGESTPVQVAEAIRIGPYVMPRFSQEQLSDRDVDALARYVELTQEPDDRGGWGIGHIGPVPEGLVAWLAALASLLLIARLVGERTEP
jgi:ubiquinol-cytochrome c reductase cytochrome c subunit